MLIRPNLSPADNRRIQAMLRANNNSGNLRQQLLDGSPLYLPLTHTAVPTRGSIVPSFIRATTETGQKWDEAGYLDFTALAGEMVFKGARRVRNLVAASSEDLTSGAWASNTFTPTTVDATTIEFTAQFQNRGKTFINDPSSAYILSFDLAVISGNTELSFIYGIGTDIPLSATSNIVRYSLLIPPFEATTNVWGVQDRNASGFGQIYLSNIQIEDVTGQADQTASEYVSVGVESAPAYHGSMVDGVKCYDTDRSGNPISTSGSYPLVGYVPWEARTNLCTKSQEFDAWGANTGGAGSLPVVTANAGVAPDGTTTADKVVFVAPGAGDISQMYSPAFATVAASSYTAAVHVKAFAAGDVGKQILIRHVGGVAYTAITLTADWQRLGNTEVAVAGTGEFDILLRPTFGGSSGTVSCYLWQADVQLGTFITPAIPTTTVAVARNSDVLTYTGADVANIKTLACTFSRGVGVSGLGVETVLSDGTGNTYFGSYLSSATAQNFRGVSASVDQWIQAASNAYTPGATAKASTSVVTNNILMDFNGTAQLRDTLATVPTVSQINVGHLAGAFVLNGPVGQIFAWTRNLSQSELAAVDR